MFAYHMAAPPEQVDHQDGAAALPAEPLFDVASYKQLLEEKRMRKGAVLKKQVMKL